MRVMCLILLPILTGCFTIVQGTTDRVRFFSEPSGAKVTFCKLEGITPCEIHIPRGKWPQMIEFSLAGHETATNEIASLSGQRALAPAYVAAFIDGLLLLPAFIEMATGVFYGWPFEIHAKLPSKSQGAALVHIQRNKPGDWGIPIEEIDRQFGKAPISE